MKFLVLKRNENCLRTVPVLFLQKYLKKIYLYSYPLKGRHSANFKSFTPEQVRRPNDGDVSGSHTSADTVFRYASQVPHQVFESSRKFFKLRKFKIVPTVQKQKKQLNLFVTCNGAAEAFARPPSFLAVFRDPSPNF